jgi:branched-chain amino acid transport system permease protein
MQLLHFGHGGVVMFSAYIAMTLILQFKMNFIVAFIIAMLIGGLLGVAIERLAYRPLRSANVMSTMIAGVGLGIILENVARLIFGSYTQPFPQEQAGLKVHVYHIGENLYFNNYQIYTFIIAILLVVVLQFIIHKTKTGLAIQATAQNPNAASLMGINRDFVVSATFFIGSAMATAAGVMFALIYNSLYPTMGALPGQKAFCIVILGGLGSIPGTIIGGLFIGLSEVFGSVYLPPVINKHAIAFALLILVMVFRPQGIFGKRIEKV